MAMKKLIFSTFLLLTTSCFAMQEQAQQLVEEYKTFAFNFIQKLETLPLEKQSDLLIQLIMKYKYQSLFSFDSEASLTLTHMNIIDAENNIIKPEYFGILFAKPIAETGFIHFPDSEIKKA